MCPTNSDSDMAPSPKGFNLLLSDTKMESDIVFEQWVARVSNITESTVGRDPASAFSMPGARSCAAPGSHRNLH